MRFRATLFLGGKTATGIRVPAEVVASFGAGERSRSIAKALLDLDAERGG